MSDSMEPPPLPTGYSAAPPPTPSPIPARPIDHRAACPNPGEHYYCMVNKNDINMRFWGHRLNNLYTRGYRLAHVFEQHGNTVQVFEHAYH